VKEGIYLGPRRRRSRVGPAAVLAAAVATVVLAAFYVRADREVARLEAEVSGARGGESRTTPSSDDALRIANLRLSAALSVGAAGSIPSTDVLRLVASALPAEMTLVSLAVSAPPRRSLRIEAETSDSGAVTALQQNVSASPMVAQTRLLEERRLSANVLSVRFEIELREPRTR
jgi:hypothetical protein